MSESVAGRPRSVSVGIVEGEPRLEQQPVGAGPPGLAGGVQTHAGLSHPDEEGADPGGQRHRRVGHADARLQEDAGHAADGDMDANAVLVDQDESAVEDVEPAPLQEEDRTAFAHLERTQGRKLVHSDLRGFSCQRAAGSSRPADEQEAATEALGGAEALPMLQRCRPDVLISDIEMPNQDGYSLIRRIRALEPGDGGKTPAVALSAYSRPEDRIRSLLAGFNLHVSKPVEPSELTTVVASLAGRVG